jgi:hypothetical protein
MCLVLSGTGIELQVLSETLVSSALKPASYQLQHDIGMFEDPEYQAEYIKQVLMYQQIGLMRCARNFSTAHLCLVAGRCRTGLDSTASSDGHG